MLAGSVAFDHWAAAVEAVWRAVALGDVLYSLHDQRYRAARAAHCDGETGRFVISTRTALL